MPAMFDSGMFVRVPAWHGEGVVLDDYPGSWAEAAKAAGLDWEPIRTPTYDRELVGMDEHGEPTYSFVEDPDHVFVKRSDTLERLDVANASYELIPNAAMGEVVEALLDQDSGVKYNTAGSLYGGRKVWALAEIAEPIYIGKDPSPTARYLALLNSHDGSAALRAIATSVRIVCANTWHAADVEGQQSGHDFTFKHTKNWRDKLEEARDALMHGRKQSEAVVEAMQHLASVKVTKRQTELFITEFVPMPIAQVVSDRVVSNVESTRQEIRQILASPTCTGITGTAYGLVQAAGEYLDHVRAYKSWSSYVNRTLLRPEKLKAHATRLALAAAND